MNKYNWSKQTLNLNNENIYVPCKMYFEYIYKHSLHFNNKKKLMSLLLKNAGRTDFEKIFLLEYSKKFQYKNKKSKFFNLKKLILKILDFKFEFKSNFYIHEKKYDRFIIQTY